MLAVMGWAHGDPGARIRIGPQVSGLRLSLAEQLNWRVTEQA
jgi:hypothetical protein